MLHAPPLISLVKRWIPGVAGSSGGVEEQMNEELGGAPVAGGRLARSLSGMSGSRVLA